MKTMRLMFLLLMMAAHVMADTSAVIGGEQGPAGPPGPTGATGPAGEDGESPTNANVNAAIADDPEASQSALKINEDGLFSGRLPNYINAFNSVQGEPKLVLASFGDSLSVSTAGPVLRAIQTQVGLPAYGIGCWQHTLTSGTTNSDNHADFTTGLTYTLSSGGSSLSKLYIDPGYGATKATCERVKIYVIKKPGAGTLTVKSYDIDDVESTLGTFDCSNASEIGAVATFSLPSFGSYHFKLEASGGEVEFVGLCSTFVPGVYGGSGVRKAFAEMHLLGRAGTTLDELYEASTAITGPILEDISPNLVLVTADDGLATWQTHFPGLLSYLDSALTAEFDTIGFCTSRRAAGGEDVINEWLRSYCKTNELGYFDILGSMGSYAEISAEGSISDGVHLTAAGANRYVVSNFLRYLAPKIFLEGIRTIHERTQDGGGMLSSTLNGVIATSALSGGTDKTFSVSGPKSAGLSLSAHKKLSGVDAYSYLLRGDANGIGIRNSSSYFIWGLNRDGRVFMGNNSGGSGTLDGSGFPAGCLLWHNAFAGETPCLLIRNSFTEASDSQKLIDARSGGSLTSKFSVSSKGLLISKMLRVETPTVPASATATGTAGDISWDASYIYVCTATNTWKRVAISTW